MATKKLRDIKDPPKIPEADLAAARAQGATITPWNPERVQQFLAGQITLGDLEGISKPDQYKMAESGFRFLSEGKREKAKKVFEGLLALDPFDAYFHMALGSIAQQDGKLDDAEKSYSRALEINPFSAPALANRGEARLLLGRLADAMEDLAKAIQLDPEGKDPAVQRARGLAAAAKLQLDELSAQKS